MTEKPKLAASRLLSFQVSDENRDGGRLFRSSGAHSVSLIPARIALQREENARAPMRIFPALRKKRATPGIVWPVCFTWPSGNLQLTY